MRQFAVFSEALAMVGGEDDECRTSWRARIEERAERMIGPSTSAAYGSDGYRVANSCGAWYGACGSNEHEREPFVALRIDPGHRRCDDSVCTAVWQREIDGGPHFTDAIVIHVEAGIESEPRVEWKSTDEAAGRESQRLESCRRRRLTALDAISVVVPDAVLKRIEAGQQRGVRRQCDDRMRVCEGEPRTMSSQRVDMWGLRPTSVRRQNVSSERIDRHQKHVAIRIALNGE